MSIAGGSASKSFKHNNPLRRVLFWEILSSNVFTKRNTCSIVTLIDAATGAASLPREYMQTIKRLWNFYLKLVEEVESDPEHQQFMREW